MPVAALHPSLAPRYHAAGRHYFHVAGESTRLREGRQLAQGHMARRAEAVPTPGSAGSGCGRAGPSANA